MWYPGLAHLAGSTYRPARTPGAFWSWSWVATKVALRSPRNSFAKRTTTIGPIKPTNF